MRSNVITKEDVIRIAQSIIEVDGLGKCSMRRIAGDLNIAVGTLYNYYDSREQLLEELFNVSWKETIQSCYDYLDNDQPQMEQIRGLFAVIDRDVKRRNGLGRQVLAMDNRLNHSKTLSLQMAITTVIRHVVNRSEFGEDKKERLANLIFLIEMDAISRQRDVTEVEYEMIGQLLGTDEVK